jgi:hypothetical protein
MNRNCYTLFLIIISLLLTSCEFISNANEYGKTTEEFTEALLKEDYDKCIDLFAIEHERAQNVSIDEIKAGLPAYRELIISNFGEELEYTLMSAEKKFSSAEGETTEPNTTNVLVQIENKEEFGVLKVLFDDISKKVLYLEIQEVKGGIPNLLSFWLFGLIAICIPIFNIYIIIQIRKSKLKRKWLKYLAVMFFNIPSITYSALSGLGFLLLNFQFLFGISFEYSGYMNSFWSFGIPLGGIYWFWRLRNGHKEAEEFEEGVEISNDEILDNIESN